MVGIVKEINGQKKIVPLTTDTGTGAAVGTLVSQYKKVPMSGYLYCDGSTFDQNDYPALYMYLGTNVLPDYRECVMVGAEQNTTDTIATHDVYGEGEFKDDQMQSHRHLVKDTAFGSPLAYGMDAGNAAGVVDRTVTGQLTNRAWEAIGAGLNDTVSRYGETTHGKQKAVYVYIKATSGLAENQQENVLNDVKGYVDNSNSYSTNEVKTGGKWIDGKPIYRKTISFGDLPNNAIKKVAHGINNLGMIISTIGITTDNLSLYMPIPVPFPNGVSASFYITKTEVILNTTTDYTYYKDTYITIEYTKTTD